MVRNGISRVIIGGGLIVVGALFLLEKLEIITDSLWTYWPVLLILFGVGVLVKKN